MTLPADPVTSSRFPGPRESWRILLESERFGTCPADLMRPKLGAGVIRCMGAGVIRCR